MFPSMHNINATDNFQQMDSAIHRLHPSVKIIITLIYILTLTSFGRYEGLQLLPMIIYPAVIFAVSGVPIHSMLLKILAVQPFVIAVGIFNPFFDTNTVNMFDITFSAGWFTFFSIIIKSTLAVTSALLLFSVTGINNIAFGLRSVLVPKIFVLQLVLTYRYIGVLMEELSRSLTAYHMRSFRKGIQFTEWGSLPGHLLLRSIERAERVYTAMCLRGFNGEYNIGRIQPFKVFDAVFAAAWIIIFISIRHWNIPQITGKLLQGVFT